MLALPVIILGLIWPLALTGPPPAWLWCLLVAASFCCLIFSALWRPWWWPCLGFAMAATVAWHIQDGLDQRLSLPVETSLISGTVISLPVWQGDRRVFLMRADHGPWLEPKARRLEVRWRQPDQLPRVGERWQLPLRLMPPRGRINFSGEDRERVWFAARIHGLATVKGAGARRLATAQGYPLGRSRQAVHERLKARLDELPGSGLVIALALGERSGLSRELRGAMRGTGTGHLLAISGLHVGLVAVFGFGLFRALLQGFGWRHARWPAQRLAIVLGFVAAAVYAGLAGFGTSPRRALVMLGVVAAAFVLRRRVDPWQGWLFALALVLLLDPLASLQAGFWLSFGAVAVLLHQFQGRLPAVTGLRGLVRAQVGLGIALLPLTMGWFQWVSVSAFVVNLLAIPWVSLVTLPLVLLTLIALPLEQLPAHVIADMAARSAHWLEQMLVLANDRLGALAWRTVRPSVLSLLLAMAGGALCLLPPAFKLRRFGLLLLLPLLLPAQTPLDDGEWRLTLLDTGQGQAAFVQTHKHLALVDTGPGLHGQWDLVDSVVLPSARQLRRKPPDLVLVSHGDMDHAGGWPRLYSAWPGAAWLGNMRDQPSKLAPCHDGRGWVWDGVSFQVLHPTRWLPYRGNDSSCVLSVAGAAGRLLMPGDVGALVERRLARQPLEPFDVMLAPHHGSRTSSSQALLDWAQPQSVLIPAGFANRFGFPHTEVLERYRRQNILVSSTAQCGALRLSSRNDGSLKLVSARHQRRAFWRWLAPESCSGRPGRVPESTSALMNVSMPGAKTLTSPEAFRYHAGHSNKTSESKE